MLPTYTKYTKKKNIENTKIDDKTKKSDETKIDLDLDYHKDLNSRRKNINEIYNEIFCPQCNKEPGHMYLNDGGSHHCIHCKTVFHYCACFDCVKYGSPGPSMC